MTNPLGCEELASFQRLKRANDCLLTQSLTSHRSQNLWEPKYRSSKPESHFDPRMTLKKTERLIVWVNNSIFLWTAAQQVSVSACWKSKMCIFLTLACRSVHLWIWPLIHISRDNAWNTMYTRFILQAQRLIWSTNPMWTSHMDFLKAFYSTNDVFIIHCIKNVWMIEFLSVM